LGLGAGGKLPLRLELCIANPVKHRGGRPADGGHAHAEGHASRDLAHDPLNSAERREVRAGQLGAGRLVAAADVVADP